MHRAPRPDDKALGMDRDILRRDFLNGGAVLIGAAGLGLSTEAEAANPGWPQDQPGYYPPTLQGLRGSHVGAFEAAHALRDGAALPPATPLPEAYDLIVVGAGISGLSAAYFWRQKHPEARILILDNHDDFGGHAKRNEVMIDGQMRLMNGGTLMIDSPFPYSPVADGLLKDLGVDPVALSKKCEDHDFYRRRGMGRGVFFDKETFGKDRLVAGLVDGGEDLPPAMAVDNFVDQTPLSDKARDDLRRMWSVGTDPLAQFTSDQKKDQLSRISYLAYLQDWIRVDAKVVAMFQTISQGEWAAGIDSISALDAWGFGFPGFACLKLDGKTTARMSFTPRGYRGAGGSYRFHFPDGNASIARLLVRTLVPSSLGGSTATDIVTARCDYSRLDRPENRVRLRLSSTVVNARHEGILGRKDRVRVTYIRGGTQYSVSAPKVIMACYNMIIPYIVPELPEMQKVALHDLVKEPLVYTTVGIRNWKAFEALKVNAVLAPNGYYNTFSLDPAVGIGDYPAATDPTKPTLLRMTRTPCQPGLSEHDQNRAGRAELLATPFETFERETRAQLARTLGPGGFDVARDISAIIVNRWPHGYAPERNLLWEAEISETQTPQVVGRQRFGRIAIANSDCGGGAYTDVAIDMAHRAVMELL